MSFRDIRSAALSAARRLKSIAPACRKPRAHMPFEALEARKLFTTVAALTSTHQLVTFDTATPGTVSSPISFSGLGTGETINSIDFRPATGQLLGLSSTGRLYSIVLATGTVTAVGSVVGNTGTDLSIEVDPQADVVRLVSNTQENIRRSTTTGALVMTDQNLAYLSTDPGAGKVPNIASLGYSNNIAGATITTLYGIDASRDTLVLVGSAGGSPQSPNTGSLSTVGALGINVGGEVGFDISAGATPVAYLLANEVGRTDSRLYTVNLTTGAATLVGTVGDGNTKFLDVAVGVSVITFSSATVAVAENIGTANITVTRTGDTSSSATASFATANGTAIAGSDFTGLTGNVTFAPGETTKTISVAITDDTVVDPGESFTIVLSNPSAGASLGTISTTTVSITDNEALPTLSIANTSSPEGNAGGTNTLTFTVTLSAASTQVVTVNASTTTTGTATGSTSTSTGDYTISTATLTFAPGETTKTFSVPIIGDATPEADETVGVVLTTVSNAALGTTVATGTIVNDDAGGLVMSEPQQPGKSGIVVNGTPGDDVILIRTSTAKATKGQIEVVVNGTVVNDFATKNIIRLTVFAGAGDDDVRIDPNMGLPALLEGGDGNDILVGSKGKDILIGGAGVDSLYGRGNDDILIGSSTNFDSNFNALAAVHQRWIGPGNFVARASFVQSGSGITGAFKFATATIINDSAADYLAGDGKTDLIFVVNLSKDRITDADFKGLKVSV